MLVVLGEIATVESKRLHVGSAHRVGVVAIADFSIRSNPIERRLVAFWVNRAGNEFARVFRDGHYHLRGGFRQDSQGGAEYGDPGGTLDAFLPSTSLSLLLLQ